MRLSAENQFSGTVESVQRGAVNGIVTLDVRGTPVTATISLAAIDELSLAEGDAAFAVFDANDVMVSRCRHLSLSARNQFPGRVLSVERGAVNSIVRIDALCGLVITAMITNTSVDNLHLAPGVDAAAVVKATSVMVGVDDLT